MARMIDAYTLFHRGIEVFAEVERNGLRLDGDYLVNVRKELSDQIAEVERQFTETELYSVWFRTFGSRTNLSSISQLAKVLFDVMGLKPVRLTDGGKGSVDEDALELLDLPDVNLLLRARKLRKVRDTYLAQFAREVNDDGFIRPSFSLHLVRTYRSSSSNPNFQNIPKRDRESLNYVRRAIYPRRGHELVEVDFSAIEVMVSTFYHKDPEMIRYVTQPDADMHADMARQIFCLAYLDKKDPPQALLRQAAKNGFVFPQFYGDYYKSCARHLLNWIKLPTQGVFKSGTGVPLNGSPIADHLRSVKLNTAEAFTDHIRRVEEDFWGRRFRVYGDWKRRWVAEYRKRGYLRMLTGFVVAGPLRDNEITNYPIQGTAFHILLRTIIHLHDFLSSKGMDTRLVGQIHDSMVLDANPDEVDEVLGAIRDIVARLPEEWPWVIVPLEVEVERFGRDMPWVKV